MYISNHFSNSSLAMTVVVNEPVVIIFGVDVAIDVT